MSKITKAIKVLIKNVLYKESTKDYNYLAFIKYLDSKNLKDKIYYNITDDDIMFQLGGSQAIITKSLLKDTPKYNISFYLLSDPIYVVLISKYASEYFDNNIMVQASHVYDSNGKAYLTTDPEYPKIYLKLLTGDRTHAKVQAKSKKSDWN